MIRTETAKPATNSIAQRALAARDGGGARLPQSYEAAKTALANCEQIDECLTWADKAAALASYAKMAKDDELMKRSTRIRDRAIRRAGELLKQIKPASGARTDLGSGGTRGSVAKNAGMSERQQKTALRVANVPADEFERQVESDTPPGVKSLAEQGKQKHEAPDPQAWLKGRDPAVFNTAMHFVAEFEAYSKALSGFEIETILPTLTPDEAGRVRKAVAAIDAIHDRIITRI